MDVAIAKVKMMKRDQEPSRWGGVRTTSQLMLADALGSRWAYNVWLPSASKVNAVRVVQAQQKTQPDFCRIQELD